MQKLKINKTLVSNITSLTVLQTFNYLIPLITLPYLVRVLGPSKFGLVNFAAAFIAYFITLTDYGFNLSATKDISTNRGNTERVNEIFSSVMIIKLCLITISIIILHFIISSFRLFAEHQYVYYLSFLIVLGYALFPIWFFQGIEEMKYISIITIAVRLISVIFIFSYVIEENDFLVLIGINGFTQLVIGLIGLCVVIIKYHVKFRIQSLEILKHHFYNGGYIFLSTVAINLYTTTNTVILGLFASNTIVGYFTAADKVRMALQSAFSTLSQAVYPHLSFLFKQSFNHGMKFIYRLIKFVGSLAIITSLIFFIFAEKIIMVLFGDQYLESVMILRIIAFLPFIIFLSNVYGIQVMLNLGFKKEFSMIIASAALINLILSLILVPVLFEVGTSISIILTEVFVTGSVFLFTKYKIILERQKY